MGELGQTTDPTVLIPGDPTAVEDAANELIDYGSGVEDCSDDLRNADIPYGWDGIAANAFVTALSPLPSRWYTVSDGLAAAGGALQGYADVLRWAQGQAVEAIARWEDSEPLVLTEAAAEVIRDDARAILDNAREQLAEAGDAAADVIAGRGQHGGPVAGMLAAVPASAGGGLRPPDTGSDGDDSGLLWIDERYEFGDGTEAAFTVGPAGGASWHLGTDGLVGSLRGEIAVTAQVDNTTELSDSTNINNHLEARAGVDAGAGATINGDGINVQGDAFAGGRVNLDTTLNMGNTSVGGHFEGQAGVGVQGGVRATFDDGRIHLGVDGGASLVVGGRARADVVVDPEQIGNNLEHELDTVTTFDPRSDNEGGLLNDLDRFADAVGDSPVVSAMNPFD